VSRMRTRGFTLIELMVVIVVVGIILTYGFPKIRALLIKNDLRSARSTLFTAIQQAKTWAVNDGRATTVRVNPATGALWITASPTRLSGHTVDTVGSLRNLTDAYGATLTTPTSQDTFAFDHRGLLTPVGSSTQQIIVVSRSGYRDSVMINGYGRITK
jgi:prepilin-type N-terminal cleavage/methylation domain-containing protein